MSKGHMQDLQGFRTISSPSASPVDAYGGGVNAPKVSAADQLASAFGTVSKYGQRAAAQQQAEDDKLREDEAQAFINRYKAEEDGDILTAIKAGELYPQVSHSFLARAIEKKSNYETQTSYLETFSKLDDDVVLDDVKLHAFLGSEEDKIREQYKDNPFVLSGALTGFRAAKSQQMPGILGRQAKATKDIDTTNINNFSILTLDKYNLETEEGYNAAVEAFEVDLDNSINTSINENSVVNQTYVDSIIAYAKLNPSSGATRLLSDKRLKHLNTNTTRAKLSEANKQISQLAVAELERKQKEQQVLNKQKLVESQSKLNQLAVNGDIAGIDRIMAQSTGLTGNDAVLGNKVYQMAEIAKQAAQVKADVSATNYTTLKDEISVSASLGTAGDLESMIAKVNERTDIHPNEKAVLIKELPNLLLGNQIIASASHKSALGERLGGTIKTYTDNPNFLVKGFQLGQLATSFSDIATETWNQETKRLVNLHLEKNGEVPGYAALHDDGGIYDRAEGKVRARLQEVNQMTEVQLQILGQQQQPQQTQTEQPTGDSTYGATFEAGGVTYGLPVGIDSKTATDADWVAISEGGTPPPAVPNPLQAAEDNRRLADLVTTVFRSENDPSLTQNKGSRSYAQAMNELNKMPKEELDAFVQPLAEQAIASFTERLDPDTANAIPYTQRDEVQELIQLLEQNPANIFSDNDYAERFLETTLK
jgi:hypothetical protein